MSRLLIIILLVVTGCAQLPKRTNPPSTDHQRYLPTVGVNINYRDIGEGEPIVLVHGFGQTLETWQRLIPELSKQYRVIALDLKGSGHSDKPSDGRYGIGDQADVVMALVEALNLARITLVGHSLGGGVALLVALRWQERGESRVVRLALMNSVGFPMKLPRMIASLRWPVLGPFMLYLSNPDRLVRGVLRNNAVNDDAVTEELVRAYADSLRAPGGRAALVSTARQLDPKMFDSMVPRYAGLRAPALVLWCREDPVLPVEHVLRFHEELPRAHVTLLRGCGHSPQEERPLEVYDALLHFLAGPIH
jgi:pimeloyl-ACP methyl ester carboxylesterase